MAKFKFEMSKKEAILAVKKALNGKVAVLSDKNDCLTVGAPMMTAKICFTEGEVTTSGALFGKIMVSTVDSAIEITEGFEKV